MRPLLALLLLAPLAVGAPVPKAVKAKLPDYYPLADGTTWVYAMGTVEVTVRATDVTDKDGVRTAKLVTERDGKSVASESVRVNKDGVFRTHINGTEIKPAFHILKFGLADEEGWETNTEVGGTKVTGKFTLKGTEKLTVDAGEYEAVRVSGKSTIGGTDTETDWWLADGVGMVKIQYTIGGSASTPLELKKYTPGKAK